MEQTSKYHLSQWAGEDRILREDFNADNVKTENALADHETAQNALQAALAGCGNCTLVSTNYIGNGKYGSSNPCKATFGSVPTLVLVIDPEGHALFMHSDSTYAYYGNSANFVLWNGQTVSWYCNGAADLQFNTNGKLYRIFALILST